MLELAAALVVSAIAVTFFSDLTSRAVKMLAPRKRKGEVHEAHPRHSAA